MLTPLLQLAVIAWLPGTVLFRLPLLRREKRESLDAEERLFWGVILSICVSSTVALTLAAIHRYSFGRLIVADIVISMALAAAVRFRLRFGTLARRPGPTALIPVALILLGAWRFFPPSEYVIGGKDPGVYVNEGIQIAQRGTLVYKDPVVAAVPPLARDLFFPSHQRTDYYGVRFMGFFVKNPDDGTVVGQFPHLFPVSIAIGYGVRGLSGAREAVAVWGVLGLLAVYFAARRLVGTAAAAAAAALLAFHIIQVWFARYPSAEMVMQALLFAALLASARAHADDDGFFAPVAGLLLGLLLFLRIDAVLGIAGVAAGLVLAVLNGGRIRWSFAAVLLAFSVGAIFYLAGPMRAYVYLPIVFLTNLRGWQYALLGAAALTAAGAVGVARRRPAVLQPIATIAPSALSVLVVVAAVYALYLRHPSGRLAAHDAYAFRSFTVHYATLPGIIAALIGFVTTARRAFWRAPELFATVTLFSFFLFYKIRIVPEHFWMARRFVSVILPGVLILACAAAAWGFRRTGARRIATTAIGATFIVLLGNEYARAARPVVNHVEYAGIIAQLEQLSARVADDDLLIVESRDAASDAHVMALPLAYIYARNVLVLASARPDRQAFGPFLDWARSRYRHVYFLGGGGTDLLSRQWTATSVASQRFQVPEYEVSAKGFPRTIRMKEFDFGLYELRPAALEPGTSFDLDIGMRDDLNVVRFHAKEVADGRTMRWTQRQSFVTVPAMPAGARTLVLVMSSGGRPEAAPPAEISVYLNEQSLGSARVASGFRAYTFTIPDKLAMEAAAADEPVRIRLVTPVWNPRQVLGSPDDRELGIMLDQVQVR